MPIIDPQGSESHWIDGLPFGAIQKSSSPPDPGAETFWLDGQPYNDILGAATGGGGGGSQTFPALFLAP